MGADQAGSGARWWRVGRGGQACCAAQADNQQVRERGLGFEHTGSAVQEGHTPIWQSQLSPPGGGSCTGGPAVRRPARPPHLEQCCDGDHVGALVGPNLIAANPAGEAGGGTVMRPRRDSRRRTDQRQQRRRQNGSHCQLQRLASDMGAAFPPVCLHESAAVFHELAGRGGREGRNGGSRRRCCTVGRGLCRCWWRACNSLQGCRGSWGTWLQTGSQRAAAQVRRATCRLRAGRRVCPEAVYGADGCDARHTELCTIEEGCGAQQEMAMRRQA